MVENPTELDYKTSETVVDTLPAGLTVKSVSVGNTALNIAGDSRELHNSDENCKKEHTITYTAETNSLKWDIGCLAAHESVTISFVCTVDMDSVDNREAIYNTAKLTDGTYSINRVGIEYPIEITKSVEENTAVAYSSGQIFHYTITVVNNEKYPSEKKNLDLVDTLPQGLLPYPEENGDGVLYLANEENETGEVISWSKFAAGEYTGTTGFYTTVDGRKADVTRTTTGQIKLTWHIEDMSQVKTITLTYLAQMTLTEEQQATGTAYAFKNIATIDNLSSSVIVKGGTLTGNLTLCKTFSKYFLTLTKKNWI